MSSKKVKQYLKRCNEALSAGDFDGAMKEVVGALAIESGNYTVCIFKGKILTEQKKFQLAEKTYKELIDLEPEKLLAYKGLASVYQKGNEYECLLDINMTIISKFGVELNDKLDQMILHTIELATNLENWDTWFTIFNNLDGDIKKSIILDFWERIPFRILEENEATVLIPTTKSKTFTVFKLWHNSINDQVIEDFIPEDWIGMGVQNGTVAIS